MKACKDCKWAKISRFDWLLSGWRFAHCYHPKIGPKDGEVNRVTGKTKDAEYWFCDTNRQHISECGYEGRYFEPRITPTETKRPYC